ncbi:hypothetical protein GWK47_046457 [Chionoecetes opilio]|uniref:Uncharacterized protein n=1 Tax=Chionoecetes opilio TaxID=41210 RepID=A0A8J4Y5I8_CHIOP|nr:hypothetical protein GWK47_046457 [Chionoecetes opilio]
MGLIATLPVVPILSTGDPATDHAQCVQEALSPSLKDMDFPESKQALLQIAIPNIEEEQRNDSFCAPIIYYLSQVMIHNCQNYPSHLTEFRLQYNLLVRDTYLTTGRETQTPEDVYSHRGLVAFVVYTLLQNALQNGINSLEGDKLYDDIGPPRCLASEARNNSQL